MFFFFHLDDILDDLCDISFHRTDICMLLQERQLATVRRGGAKIGGSMLRTRQRYVGLRQRLLRQSLRDAFSEAEVSYTDAITKSFRDTWNFERSATLLFEHRTRAHIVIQIVDEW